jgi:S1-C subfamily serine protease
MAQLGIVAIGVVASPAPVAHPGRGDALDIVLVLLALGYAFAGFRRGLVVGLLSFAGFVVGAYVGTVVGPTLAARISAHAGSGQRVLALVLVGVFAVAGQTIGSLVGGRLRRVIALTPVRWADAAGGAAIDVIGFLLVAWLLAFALASAPYPSVTKQIRNSAILNAINGVMPNSAPHLFASLDRLLQQHELPALGNPFSGLPVPPAVLPPPDTGVVPPALRAAGPAIVKIRGSAPSCSRQVEGSGFIFATDHVLTNAHVVAGVHDPSVALPMPNARVLAARVVLYDPNRDVAVLDVPGLGRTPLHFGGRADTGSSAVVAGYPEDGPLTAVAARVAGDQDVTGPNIYANRQVTRDVYTLRARVRPGNSGGPLLSPDGLVLGVVFAAAVDQPDVGYALTASEVSSDARAGATASRVVSTHGCD